MPAHRLAYWQRVIESSAAEVSPGAGPSAGFVAVIPASASPPSLEIHVGAARIMVGRDFDAAQLRAIVAALS